MDPYSWALHWDVLLVIGALTAAYYWSQRRYPSDTKRHAAFDLAIILLLAVYVTPLHTIALHYLLSVHLLQNVVTAEWAPGLIVYAVAPALGRKVAPFIHPLVAVFLLIWFGGIGSTGFLLLFKQHISFATFDFMPLGMFIFGLTLTYFGFFPEALKAKHLIEEAVAIQDNLPKQ